jgi:hypothetical protein
MVRASQSIGRIAVLLAAAAIAACSSNDGSNLGGGPDPTALSAARSEPSGNGQSGTGGQDASIAWATSALGISPPRRRFLP